MKIVGTVDNILARKGGSAWSIRPDAYVYDALKLMAEKNIGALLVVENHRLVGMMSERDYARKIVLAGKTSKDTLVREIMSNEIISVTPQNTVDECMRIMTEQRIRHLPVAQEDRVIGIVSIGV